MQTICKLQIHCPIGIFAYLCRHDSNYKRIYEKGISLSGRYSWNSYDLLIGDALSRQNARNGSATLRFSMKPTRWLSIEEESAYRYSHRSRTDALQSMEHQLKICYTFVM